MQSASLPQGFVHQPAHMPEAHWLSASQGSPMARFAAVVQLDANREHVRFVQQVADVEHGFPAVVHVGGGLWHEWFVHRCPSRHGLQATAKTPQAALVEPGWHSPFESQQPAVQFVELHVPMQTWFGEHVVPLQQSASKRHGCPAGLHICVLQPPSMQ